MHRPITSLHLYIRDHVLKNVLQYHTSMHTHILPLKLADTRLVHVYTCNSFSGGDTNVHNI